MGAYIEENIITASPVAVLAVLFHSGSRTKNYWLRRFCSTLSSPHSAGFFVPYHQYLFSAFDGNHFRLALVEQASEDFVAVEVELRMLSR